MVKEFPTRQAAFAFFDRQKQATLRTFQDRHFVFVPSYAGKGHFSTADKFDPAFQG